jgi:hypothetical protein
MEARQAKLFDKGARANFLGKTRQAQIVPLLPRRAWLCDEVEITRS